MNPSMGLGGDSCRRRSTPRGYQEEALVDGLQTGGAVQGDSPTRLGGKWQVKVLPEPGLL